MTISELYSQIPPDKHHEVVVSGDRLYYDGDEYIIHSEDEITLIRTQKTLEQKLEEIKSSINTAK
jgi:hypothetical protein